MVDPNELAPTHPHWQFWRGSRDPVRAPSDRCGAFANLAAERVFVGKVLQVVG
jgi:hypothetical protein